MSLSVDIYGVQKVIANLQKMQKAIPEGAQRGLILAGHVIEGEAKIRCPVDIGTLMGSISVEPETPDKDSVTVGPHTDYGAYVEFGTSRTAAQPYMRPALTVAQPDIARLVGAEVIREISSVLPSD